MLDRFWSLRGVQSAERRLGLVRLGDAAAAAELPDHDPSDAAMDAFWGDFCGLRDTSAAEISRDLGQAVMLWEADGDLVSGERIREISRRALRLHRLLGGEGADVAMMAVKEPRVLDVEAGAVVQVRWLVQRGSGMPHAFADTFPDTSQLWMSAATPGHAGSRGVDSGPRHCSHRPGAALPSPVRVHGACAAVLEFGDQNDATGSPSAHDARLSPSQVDPGENAGQRQGAWRAGLVSDNDPAWEARFQELLEYKARVGDAHVGFRDGDNRDLARWCRAQRTALREGRLPDARRARLAQAGFRFDEADAEWLRWYAELKRTVADKGVAYPDPLGDNTNYYLINWCAVQRVAMRCRKLSPEKVGLLESLGFDWSGADPLS